MTGKFCNFVYELYLCFQMQNWKPSIKHWIWLQILLVRFPISKSTVYVIKLNFLLISGWLLECTWKFYFYPKLHHWLS
jgi:hypothetical protein